jgi:hypothetical protein
VTNLPEPTSDQSVAAGRRLSTRDFELVIRRAAELQAREAEEFGGEGISEAEAMRIGRELGLSNQNLHRALAETSGAVSTETGVMAGLFGQGNVRAGRAVPGNAETVARTLETYLVEREYLVVLRRFPDRVLFTRASGMVAAMGRATSQFFSRSAPLRVENLEMSVQPFEEGYTFVSVATSVTSSRTATAASSLVGGGAVGGLTAAILGIAVAPPAALVAIPIIGLSGLFGRAYYKSVVRNLQTQLESLLDRLEHGDLPPPIRARIPSRR